MCWKSRFVLQQAIRASAVLRLHRQSVQSWLSGWRHCWVNENHWKKIQMYLHFTQAYLCGLLNCSWHSPCVSLRSLWPIRCFVLNVAEPLFTGATAGGNLGIALSQSLLSYLFCLFWVAMSWCCHRTGSSLTSSHLLFYLDIATKSSDLWHLLAGTTKTQRDAQCPAPPGLINQSSSLHRWHWHLCDCWPKLQHEQHEILTRRLNQPVWRIESCHPTIWGEFSPFSEPRVNGPLTSWRQNSNKNN